MFKEITLVTVKVSCGPESQILVSKGFWGSCYEPIRDDFCTMRKFCCFDVFVERPPSYSLYSFILCVEQHQIRIESVASSAAAVHRRLCRQTVCFITLTRWEHREPVVCCWTTFMTVLKSVWNFKKLLDTLSFLRLYSLHSCFNLLQLLNIDKAETFSNCANSFSADDSSSVLL